MTGISAIVNGSAGVINREKRLFRLHARAVDEMCDAQHVPERQRLAVIHSLSEWTHFAWNAESAAAASCRLGQETATK